MCIQRKGCDVLSMHPHRDRCRFFLPSSWVLGTNQQRHTHTEVSAWEARAGLAGGRARLRQSGRPFMRSHESAGNNDKRLIIGESKRIRCQTLRLDLAEHHLHARPRGGRVKQHTSLSLFSPVVPLLWLQVEVRCQASWSRFQTRSFGLCWIELMSWCRGNLELVSGRLIGRN